MNDNLNRGSIAMDLQTLKELKEIFDFSSYPNVHMSIQSDIIVHEGAIKYIDEA